MNSTKKIAKYKKILSSESLQYQVVKDEMQDIKTANPSKRRSNILKDETAFEIAEDEELKPIKDVYVCYSERNALKKIYEKGFNVSSRSSAKTSTLNEVHKFIVKTKTNVNIVLFSNLGNMYKVDIDNILEARWKDRGSLLGDLFLGYSKDEKIVGMFAEDSLKKKELLFITEQGIVRKTPWEEFETKKNTLLAYKIKDEDKVLNVEIFEQNKTLMFATTNGIGLNADISDVPSQSKGSSGVKGIKLDDGAKLVMATLVSDSDKFVCATDHCFAKIVKVSEFGVLARNRKGVKILTLGDNGKELIYAKKLLADTFELFALDSKDKLYYISTDDISTESRNSKGKSFAGKKGTKVKSIYTYLWKE
jgi:DNA gyrase subunit A